MRNNKILLVKSFSSKIPKLAILKGDNQPPKNNIAVNAEINIMLAYSAIKNTANPIPEYSTWKPATSSDSQSATSNGALFVSATPEIK